MTGKPAGIGGRWAASGSDGPGVGGTTKGGRGGSGSCWLAVGEPVSAAVGAALGDERPVTGDDDSPFGDGVLQDVSRAATTTHTLLRYTTA